MLVVPQIYSIHGGNRTRGAEQRGGAGAGNSCGGLPRRCPQSTGGNFPLHPSVSRSAAVLRIGWRGPRSKLRRVMGAPGRGRCSGIWTTETAPVIAATAPFDLHPGSVGLPVPGVSVRTGGDGEILVKGSTSRRATGTTQPQPRRHSSMAGTAWEILERSTRRATFTYAAARRALLCWPRPERLSRRRRGSTFSNRGSPRRSGAWASGNVWCHCSCGVASRAPPTAGSTDEGSRTPADTSAKSPADPAAIVRAANARLASHQRIAGFTVWPSDDFPRTHTMKPQRHKVLAAIQVGSAGHTPIPRRDATHQESHR